jgi:uncharacterized protein (DUF305 family)
MVLVLVALVVPAVSADAPVEGRAGRAEVRFLEGMIDHHQMALDMANDCLTKATTESVTALCQNIIDAQSAEIAQMQGWLLDWYNINYRPMSMNDMMGMGMSDETRAQLEQMSGMMDRMMGMDMSEDMHAQMEQMGGMMGMMMSGETMPGMDMMSTMQQMNDMMDALMGMDMSEDMHAQMEQMGGMFDMMMSGMGGMNMEGMPATDPAMMMGMMAGLNRLEGVEYEIAFLESMIDHHDDAIHMSERLLERVPEGEGHAELREQAQRIIDDQSAEIEVMEQLITELSA